MSAIRTNRANTRDGRFIAPYTRWFSRMFGIQSSEESEEVKFRTSTEDESMSSSTESDHNRQPHLTPPQYSNASKTASSASPPDADVKMDNVASFLSHSAGQSVSAEEVEGMLAIIRGNTPSEPREIFRFSSTPTRDLQSSPSTPLSTHKRLPRNPNGVYRWEGAGSAKHTRPRNRYASPVFGASPLKQDRSVMKESIGSQDTPLPDSKRRRVGDESSSSRVSTQRPSTPEPSARKVPFPSTTSPSPHANGVSDCPNPFPSPSRLRTPVKLTAPVVPSPLRQTWSETSSTSSQNETRKSPSQTKTANFMAELIKETTPPKKPDLANPYQVASPVGKVGPPRRSTKRPRATGRPVAPTKVENEEEKRKEEMAQEKEKLKEYSPQAIIEATVPKGSQRSHPPVHFAKSMDTSNTEEEGSHEGPRPQREAPVLVKTQKITYVVEEVNDTDDEKAEEARRSAKRAKPSIDGRGSAPIATKKFQIVAPEPEITIEELDDIDMDDSEQKAQPNGSSTSPGSAISPAASRNKLSSAPKEPSKLRFSFQPEGTPVPSSPAPKPAALSTPGLQKSDFKFEPPSSNFSFDFKSTNFSPGGSTTPQEQAKKMKVKARAMAAGSLPTFVMTSSATSVLPSSTDSAGMRRRVNGLPVSSLPSFELTSGPKPFSFGFDSSNPEPRPFSFTFGPSSSPPKIVGNNSSPKSSGMFTATPTPSTIEATVLKPFVGSAPAMKSFDFAAAGMKAPSMNPGTWICSLCALSNPSSALKCQTCDAPSTSTSSPVTPEAPPAPPPAPPAVPAIKAFDFAAAGMKTPFVTSGTWICSLCSLMNPMSVNQCETCETNRTTFS